MKKILAPEIELYRKAGRPNDGPFGHFELTHPETGRGLFVIASDGRDWADPQPRPSITHLPPAKRKIVEELWGKEKEITLPLPVWEHVSVSAKIGCARWDEMCWVKGVFWEPHEWVLQFHPATSENVSVHDTTLHLWRPVGVEIPTPPKSCI